MNETGMSCLRCQSHMDLGYVMDRAYPSDETAKWIGGEPDRRWHGLKTKGQVTFPLVAYRCRVCGYVELRAPNQSAE